MKAELNMIAEFFQMLDELEPCQKKRLGEKWLEMGKGELQTIIDASKLLDDLIVVEEVKVRPVPGEMWRSQVIEQEVRQCGRDEGKEYRYSWDAGYDSECKEEAVTKALQGLSSNIILTDTFAVVEV
jgi:hypothetical protein